MGKNLSLLYIPDIGLVSRIYKELEKPKHHENKSNLKTVFRTKQRIFKKMKYKWARNTKLFNNLSYWENVS